MTEGATLVGVGKSSGTCLTVPNPIFDEIGSEQSETCMRRGACNRAKCYLLMRHVISVK